MVVVLEFTVVREYSVGREYSDVYHVEFKLSTLTATWKGTPVSKNSGNKIDA